MKNLKKIMMLVALMSSFSAVFAGEVVGNGAGVIKRNGQVLTFESAGAHLNMPLKELSENDLPELRSLEQKLERLALPLDVRYKLLTASRMSVERKYFKVDLSSVPASELQILLSKYEAAVKKNPEDQFAIAAITNGNETYLFNGFFQLESLNSKLAVLAHESYWVLRPRSTYVDVIDAEMKFQSCMDSVDQTPNEQTIYCADWARSLGKLLNERFLPTRLAAYADFESGRLKKILDANGQIPLSFFVPYVVLNLTAEQFSKLSDDSIRMRIDSKIRSNREKYPNLLFLNEVLYNAMSIEGLFTHGLPSDKDIGIKLWEDSGVYNVQKRMGVYWEDRYVDGWAFSKMGDPFNFYSKCILGAQRQ